MGCIGLISIYCKAEIPPTCYTTIVDNSDCVILYVPSGCKSVYESIYPWSDFTNIKEKEFSVVDSTLTDNTVNVSVENGNIVVNGAVDNMHVDVYGTNGQCVYSGNATAIPVTGKGLYIVKVNNKSFKVIL